MLFRTSWAVAKNGRVKLVGTKLKTLKKALTSR